MGKHNPNKYHNYGTHYNSENYNVALNSALQQ